VIRDRARRDRVARDRVARDRVTRDVATKGPRSAAELAVLAVIAVLAGALAFGLWHVVVGGVIHGNRAAGQFGLALAGASGALLLLVVAVRTRRRA
jgi:predicted phage tail protein